MIFYKFMTNSQDLHIYKNRWSLSITLVGEFESEAIMWLFEDDTTFGIYSF